MPPIMRLMMSAVFLSVLAAFSAASASAQSGRAGDYSHHNFCLLTGPARQCAYETFDQCPEAAKRGNADFCEPNGMPLNHPQVRYQQYQ